MRNLLILLLALPLLAHAQVSKPVCLTIPQAAKLADSLAVLPLVRREAASWQQAAVGYRSAADSLRVADAAHRAAYQSEQVASSKLGILYSDAQTQASNWKGKARRRGILNYLLLALVGGVTYLAIK